MYFHVLFRRLFMSCSVCQRTSETASRSAALSPRMSGKRLVPSIVNEAGALIQRPDGEKYQVPLVKK